MRTRFVVDLPGDAARDLVTEIDPHAPIRALTDAFILHLQVPSGDGTRRWSLFSTRLGRWLDEAELVGQTGLRDGDTIRMGLREEPEGGRGTAVVALMFRDGPASGRQVDLPAGSYVIGRDEDCDIAVETDRWMSSRHAQISVDLRGVRIADLGSSNGTLVAGRRLTQPFQLQGGEAVKVGHSVFTLEFATRDNDWMEAELTVVSGPAEGRVIPLSGGDHLVGRSSGDVIIDDPYLSASHLRLRIAAGAVTIVETPGRNTTLVNDKRVQVPHRLSPGDVVRAGRTSFSITPTAKASRGEEATTSQTSDTISGGTVDASMDQDGRVPFNRPPRVSKQFVPPRLRLDAPPPDPEKARIPMISALFPLIGGLLMIAILTVASHGHPGPTIWITAVFMALSPVMAIASYYENKRTGKGRFNEDALKFQEKLNKLETELIAARQEETDSRLASAPAAPDLLDRATRLRSNLWERDVDDRDFASIRVGTGTLPSKIEVTMSDGGNQGRRDDAGAIIERYRTVSGVPVTMDLPSLGVVGLAGSSDLLLGPARWWIVQAVTLQGPRDLVIAACVPPERMRDWEWLKWLPHASGGSSPRGRALLAANRDEAEAVVGELLNLIRDRRPSVRAGFGEERQSWRPSVVLLVDETVAPEMSLVDELISEGPPCGIYVIWLAGRRSGLPGRAGALVEVRSQASADVTYTDTGDVVTGIALETCDEATASRMAFALAPVRDATVSSSEAGIPRRVSLLDLLGLAGPSADGVLERWQRPQEGLAAPIGATSAGPLVIDLERDGPHGLIAGTTGSGKSELLQTLVSSLSTALPPTRITWLLVDAKGGAAFKDCSRLPHSVGYVTELDPHLARRALTSLEAEVRRRENVLRDAGVRDIRELGKRAPNVQLPSLVLLIDEFATLAREIPEFVDGVVDVAQRGRSLGVHMILATQSPGGVVTGKIRANTNLRLALRTTNAGESGDVIEAPDASNIPAEIPGRAFILTGRDAAGRARLTEFQSAFVGGMTKASGGPTEVVVADFKFGSWGATARSVLGREHETEHETDLERLVEAIREAADRMQLPTQPTIWVYPLPEVLPLESLDVSLPADGDPTAIAVIGAVDEPAHQRQGSFWLDLEEDGSALVYGTSGSGKTTLLRTLAVSLAAQNDPNDLHMYGIDFATRGLAPVQALPHCGTVVLGEDQELVEHVFAMLRNTMARRKELFMGAGVGSLREYRAHATDAQPLPRIVVLFDSYAGFVAAYDRVNLGELVQELPRLVSEGRPLGIHFVITADRRGAVPGALAGVIPRSIVLALADDNEYAMVGLRPAVYRGVDLPPGRGFVDDGLDFQCAIVGKDPSGNGQALAVTRVAEALAARYGSHVAPPIRTLPTRFSRSELPRPSKPISAVIGLADADLEPVEIDLAEGHFLITGPYRSGRSTALASLVSSLHHGAPSTPLHLLAPRRSPLTEMDLWTDVAQGGAACDAKSAELADRFGTPQTGSIEGLVLVVVDDADEIGDSAAAPALEQLVRRGRDLNLRVIAAGETNAIQRAFGGWIRELRKDKHGLLLAPDVDVDGDILGIRLPRHARKAYPPGRGFLVRRGSAALIQVGSDEA